MGKPPASHVQTSLAAAAGAGTLTPTIAQLRATQAAMAKSAPSAGKQTIKQLTSAQGLTSAATPSVTTSVLTVTSVGLSMSSSLAAQLLYSPVLSPAAVSAGKLQKPSSAPITAATTFSLVTTMNASQTASNQIKLPTVPTISMLPTQQLLKQPQQQQQTASQSVLKQNAALVAAVGQTVAAATSTAALGKSTPTVPKQTFTMTARQTPPPNLVVTKNQTAVPSTKPISGLKQASLILSQDGIGNLSSATSQAGGKLVALTSVAGMPGTEGTVMAQIMQQATSVQSGGSTSRAIRLQGKFYLLPRVKYILGYSSLQCEVDLHALFFTLEK